MIIAKNLNVLTPFQSRDFTKRAKHVAQGCAGLVQTGWERPTPQLPTHMLTPIMHTQVSMPAHTHTHTHALPLPTRFSEMSQLQMEAWLHILRSRFPAWGEKRESKPKVKAH